MVLRISSHLITNSRSKDAIGIITPNARGEDGSDKLFCELQDAKLLHREQELGIWSAPGDWK